jgi:hypothetical protein
MAGLDPAIHPAFEISALRRLMDTRVKPAYDMSPYSFPANSVGVFPVTCRKAWENAGTLA